MEKGNILLTVITPAVVPSQNLQVSVLKLELQTKSESEVVVMDKDFIITYIVTLLLLVLTIKK